MAKSNRTCHFCGKEYYFCPTCNDKRDPAIYGMFDNERCKKAFNILRNNYLNKITIEEASRELKEIGITKDIDIVNEKKKEQISTILNYSSTSIQQTETKVENNMDSSTTLYQEEPEILVEKVILDQNDSGYHEEPENIEETIISPSSEKNRSKRRRKNSEVIKETE